MATDAITPMAPMSSGKSRADIPNTVLKSVKILIPLESVHLDQDARMFMQSQILIP